MRINFVLPDAALKSVAQGEEEELQLGYNYYSQNMSFLFYFCFEKQ